MINRIGIDEKINPLIFYQKIREKYSNSVLLESMDPPTRFARQSIICFDPIFMVKIENNKLYFNNRIKAIGINDIISVLRKLIKTYQVISNSIMFQGGLVGYTAYDFVSYFEEIEIKRNEDFPDALYGFYLDGIIFDHIKDEIVYFHHDAIKSRYNSLQDLLIENLGDDCDFEVKNINYNNNREDFENSVREIKELIIQGETFQTVLSQSLSIEIEGDKFGIYKKLRKINPSPYMYCLEFDQLSIIGSSPELLLSKEFDSITTYPIAGTRPRGKSASELTYYKLDLLSDEKEIAEHNMLVDLARNDVGKVSKFGSVQLPEYMTIGEFSHVIHIVSKVTGELKLDLDMFDAFLACFPAGTVSGAPKVRSMEIISKLEKHSRGPYAGAVGYFDLNNNMTQAIAIRTAFGIENTFRIQAGAGIVLDSNPESEYFETLSKLAAFLRVFEVIPIPEVSK